MAAASEPGKSVKAYNNRTTFVLGHDDCDWSTDAKDAFGWKLDQSTLDDNKLASTLASKQRLTSVNLGDATNDYTTDYGDAFFEAKDIASAKPPAVTRDLRRTNFSLGDAVCDFETDYSAGFKGAVPEVELSNHERMESKRVMAEVRKSHFSLGDTETDWSSTAAAASAEGYRIDPAERTRQQAELGEFKRELQRLHFSLGDIPTDYHTTTSMPAVDTKAARTKIMKKNTHGTNFVLGDEECDYRSTVMVMTGQERVKLDDPYVPRRDGSWKKTVMGASARKVAKLVLCADVETPSTLKSRRFEHEDPPRPCNSSKK